MRIRVDALEQHWALERQWRYRLLLLCGDEQPASGQNQIGSNPQEDPTGEGKRGKGADEWGGLQPYLNFLKNRGASPKVPEKFRRYYEAYLKNKSKGGKK